MKVFLSSTYTDLKQHRSVLLDTLLRMGDDIKISAMEYFGASPESPVETSISKVAESDMYVGVFGWRYGSLDKRTGMSITEIEYRTALANNLPVLLYLVSNDYAVKPDSVETGKNAKKIQKLRTEILGRHTIQFFSTPEDLSRLVATDLHKALRNPKEKKIDTTSSFDLNSPVPAEVNPAHPFLLCHQYKPSFTKEYFDVKLYIDLYDESYEETFPKIDKVIYQLHESFVLPVIPMQNWQEYFLLHMRVWGEFWVRAIIFFKDKKKPPIALLRYINLKLPDALEGK